MARRGKARQGTPAMRLGWPAPVRLYALVYPRVNACSGWLALARLGGKDALDGGVPAVTV
jgi:hypothetical protein